MLDELKAKTIVNGYQVGITTLKEYKHVLFRDPVDRVSGVMKSQSRSETL